jgi:hypothetical protein
MATGREIVHMFLRFMSPSRIIGTCFQPETLDIGMPWDAVMAVQWRGDRAGRGSEWGLGSTGRSMVRRMPTCRNLKYQRRRLNESRRCPLSECSADHPYAQDPPMPFFFVL